MFFNTRMTLRNDVRTRIVINDSARDPLSSSYWSHRGMFFNMRTNLRDDVRTRIVINDVCKSDKLGFPTFSSFIFAHQSSSALLHSNCAILFFISSAYFGWSFRVTILSDYF